MVVVVILLAGTNLATLGVLVWHTIRPPQQPRPDPLVARVLDGLPPPNVSTSSTRRIISIEVLNPLALASTRGRLAGIAGALAPRLVKRMVYEQTAKLMRAQLVEQGVAADLRLHTIRPERRAGRVRQGAPAVEGTDVVEPSGPSADDADSTVVTTSRLDDEPADDPRTASQEIDR